MKKISVLWIGLFLALGNLILVSTPNVNGGTPPPPDDGIDGLQYIDGDWNVNGSESYTNEAIVLTGNLTIENGGNLTFNNVTLMMNSTSDGQYHIEVLRGGSFYIYDLDNDNSTTSDASNITSYNTNFEYIFRVRGGSNFSILNSELHECGYNGGGFNGIGLYIETNNTRICNCLISRNYVGLFLYPSSSSFLKAQNGFPMSCKSPAAKKLNFLSFKI